jgi:hypothetical protein
MMSLFAACHAQCTEMIRAARRLDFARKLNKLIEGCVQTWLQYAHLGCQSTSGSVLESSAACLCS